MGTVGTVGTVGIMGAVGVMGIGAQLAKERRTFPNGLSQCSSIVLVTSKVTN